MWVGGWLSVCVSVCMCMKVYPKSDNSVTAGSGYLWIALSNSNNRNLFQLRVSFVFVRIAAGLTSNNTNQILCPMLQQIFSCWLVFFFLLFSFHLVTSIVFSPILWLKFPKRISAPSLRQFKGLGRCIDVINIQNVLISIWSRRSIPINFTYYFNW